MNLIKKIYNELGNFFILWFGQSISLLGSIMTGFAITIWAYEKTGSALVLSVSGLALMVPKMIFGILAGPFVDRANKKALMICTDVGAGLCTVMLFLLLYNESLEIGHIYCLNAVIGILGSIQTPASNVAISVVVPKKHYVRANGLQSFSEGVVGMLAPVFAATLLSAAGMTGVIIADFVSMAFACLTLVFFVRIPDSAATDKSKHNTQNYLGELRQGFKIIKSSNLLVKFMLFMAFINFVAGISFYGLLSPMILARSINSKMTLAFVNGAIGLGSIVGALVVMVLPTAKRKIKTMFSCITLSFLLGDLLFSFGNSLPIWAAAGFFSSVFLPVYMANESYFWRTIIPIDSQGRAFSLKYALQSSVIPVGSLFGGVMADYVLEPFMAKPFCLLEYAFGSGKGSGMALMFLITGTVGVTLSVLGFFSRSMQKAEKHYNEKKP